MKFDIDTVKAWADYHPDAHVQQMAIDYLKSLELLEKSSYYAPADLYKEAKLFLNPPPE